MSIKKHRQRMNKVINSRLGELFTYYPAGGEPILNCNVVINRNKPVENEYGVIAGFQIEGSILTSEVSAIYMDDTISDGVTTYKIGMIIKEFESKKIVELGEI